MDQRFAPIGATNTEANRAFWRALLFTANDGESKTEDNISGAILHEETLYQKVPAEF